MNWGVYAILIIFGAFVLLLIINPNLSCFGKRLRSPFYPMRRKREERREVREDLKRKMTDYKFDLGGGPSGKAGEPGRTKPQDKTGGRKSPDKKIEDYGFRPH